MAIFHGKMLVHQRVPLQQATGDVSTESQSFQDPHPREDFSAAVKLSQVRGPSNWRTQPETSTATRPTVLVSVNLHPSTESMWIQPGRQFSHLGKSLKYPNQFESLETFIVSKTTTQILEVFPADSRRRSTSGFALDRLSVDGCCVWQLPHSKKVKFA